MRLGGGIYPTVQFGAVFIIQESDPCGSVRFPVKHVFYSAVTVSVGKTAMKKSRFRTFLFHVFSRGTKEIAVSL